MFKWLHSLFQNNKGEIFACGINLYGACGLGHFDHPQITPSLVLSAPSNIVQFACGDSQSLFLDSGNVYSVGYNNDGDLGLGHNTNQNELNKIPNIPPIKIISFVNASGYLIDFEGNLWSFGNNTAGQLGHGDTTHKNVPKQVNTLKDIQQISYGCCGRHFFLANSEGNVYSVGKNKYGELGLGHNKHQNELNKIPNIPPIKTISCVNSSCYLIDFEGNLWTFGHNYFGQLGHGDRTNINTPKIVNTLKNIQQISYGSCGHHFLAKNSQNQIFATGNNFFGQLGTGNNESVSIPKEINSQYSNIWRDEFYTRAKSARK